MLKPEDLSLLPELPGVYRFYDLQKNLLYIGKAKSLRKRVKSYFSSSVANRKTRKLATLIAFIEYTLTTDEKAALILENNLIQILNPQFNILVRKEESLAVIQVSRHKYPQIKLTKFSRAKENIFGPYASKNDAILKLNYIKKFFKLRTCEDQEFKNRTCPCFSYQVKECSAPCVNKITAQEYNKNLLAASYFLKGQYSQLHKILKKEMINDAKNYLFEDAVVKRDALKKIEELHKSKISLNFNMENFDIILLKQVEESLFVYLVMIRAGILVGDTYYIGKYHKHIPADYIEKRYLKNYSISHIYTDFNLSSQLKKNIKATGIKIVSVEGPKNPEFIELKSRAYKNFSQLIENYSYKNLYLGGISSLKKMFNLSEQINIEYLDLVDRNLSIFIPNENIEKISTVKIVKTKLKTHLTNQDKNINPYILFIRVSPITEKYFIKTLISLNLKAIIILIKPIAHGRDAIIKLNTSLTYTLEDVIMHSGIEKLVNLLASIY
ncbi:MAG: uvrC [Burkholderiales bacterium]|jgi:excinuclease UvrABC nuclease subunit|nr:uvrC [Burkholderiales bacterium]